MTAELVEEIILATDEIIVNLTIEVQDVATLTDSTLCYISGIIDDIAYIEDEFADGISLVCDDLCVVFDEVESVGLFTGNLIDSASISDTVTLKILMPTEIEDILIDIVEDVFDLPIWHNLVIEDIVLTVSQDEVSSSVWLQSVIDDTCFAVDFTSGNYVYVVEDIINNTQAELAAKVITKESINDYIFPHSEIVVDLLKITSTCEDSCVASDDVPALIDLMLSDAIEDAILVFDQQQSVARLSFPVVDLVSRLEV